MPGSTAEAAEHGFGQWRSGFWHGSYYEPGSGYLYCLDEDRAEPIGVSTSYQGVQGFIAAAGGVNNLSGNVLAGINWLISTHGQTQDDATARAVNDAIWIVGSNYSTSDPLSNQFAAAIRAYVAPPNGGSGSMSMAFSVDRANNYYGNLTITAMSTSPASGTITLTNGVFRDTNSSTRVGSFSAGQKFAVVGVPPTQDGAPYKIRAAADLQATLPSGYAPQVGVWTVGSYQRLAGAGGPNNSIVSLRANALDPSFRATTFLPTASTQVVTESLAVGDTFKDVLSFDVGFDSNGLMNPWFKFASGAYAPVVANGTVYGPFTDRPVQSREVPEDAPVAGHFTTTTTLAEGPTISYPVASDEPITVAGYYVAVVTIDWADQSPSNPPTQAYIPEGYHFQDDFGQLVETSIVPFSLEFSTQLSTNSAAIGEVIPDTITPRLVDGVWLRDGHERVPVEVVGTWYFSSTQPEESATAPAGAEVLGTQTETLTGPDQVLETSPWSMPYRSGWATVQWCATSSIFVNGYCDNYGVPAETVELIAPTVSTQAQEAAVPSGTVHDVATVVGPVPSGGLSLSFAGYLQPVDAVEPLCTWDSVVYSSDWPVTVSGPGEYASEDFLVFPEYLGKIFWVETLTSPQGELIHQGECGLANETSSVAWPEVATAAVTSAGIGQEIHDVATVTGVVPPSGLNVSFAAYLQPAGVDEPTCTAETKIFETAAPILVTAAGEYLSESFEVTADEVGTIYWVETARFEYVGAPTNSLQRSTVTPTDNGGFNWEHVGECGLANETTHTAVVSTQAVDDVMLGQPAHDTAVVEGGIPDAEATGIQAELTFAAYRKVGNVPTCTADEQVFTTVDAPMPIDKPGTYASPETIFRGAGTYYWVETLSFRDQASGTATEIHVGKCGLPAETTFVKSPPLAFTGSSFAHVPLVVPVGLGLVLAGAVILVVVRRRRVATSSGE